MAIPMHAEANFPIGEPLPPLRELDKEARKFWVGLLYMLAEHFQRNGINPDMPTWRFAVSMHHLCRAGLARVEYLQEKDAYVYNIAEGLEIKPLAVH